MKHDKTDTTESPFRSFLLLTGACLGLAALWWLRENVWDPHGPGAGADGPRGPRPAGGSGAASGSAKTAPAKTAPAKAAPAAAAGASAAEKAAKAKPKKSEPTAANDDAPAEKATKKTVAKKAKRKTPAGKTGKAGKASKDDLSTIEGIGPKIAQVLTEAGVGTFAELAAKSADEIRELLIAVNPRYRMFDPETWPEQARLAAAGDTEKLEALQDELDGGRRA